MYALCLCFIYLFFFFFTSHHTLLIPRLILGNVNNMYLVAFVCVCVCVTAFSLLHINYSSLNYFPVVYLQKEKKNESCPSHANV